MSYNVHVGVDAERYRHYLTRGWRHVLPFPDRLRNFNRIASLVRDCDIVGMQELDAGSFRSDYINLTEYLAHRAGFPYWYDRANRRVAGIARHSMGFLSRVH
ncbi:MAG: EEP domain-containing protein, partial [Gammaproteobacteria bacterium]|nr:EEP domain-containing protein [Gammaproteobacteria bacterium]